MDGGAWWAAVHEVAQSRTQRKRLSSSSSGPHLFPFVFIFITVEVKSKLLLCVQLCDPMDYTVHGILQARMLAWVALPFFREIFPTQGLNPGLPHCRRIPYQLSHKGMLPKRCCYDLCKRLFCLCLPLRLL